jgi:hypothetical protein
MGKAVFNITLGNLTLDSELIVAEIEDEALLGLDILMKGKGGHVAIKLTEGLILLEGIAIPCTQIGQPEPVGKITAADDFIIPPRSEVIIAVFVDKPSSSAKRDTGGNSTFSASPSTVSCLISTSWSKGFINLTLFVTSCVMSTRQETIATGYFSTKKLFVGGPADIKLTEGLILLDGIAIPCTQIGQPEPVRKITAADDFIIPPRSEVIIDVFVDKFHSDNLSGPQNYLLEPNNFFVEKYPVAMASCLVDITHEVTNKVRLMNPFDHEVEIRQDTVLGEAEKGIYQQTHL